MYYYYNFISTIKDDIKIALKMCNTYYLDKLIPPSLTVAFTNKSINDGIRVYTENNKMPSYKKK